jgi:hypothetical protein
MKEYDLNLITDIDIEGIDMRDYPDFCDAFLVGATYKGRELTDEELERIQDSNPDWFYEQVWDYIY